MEVRQPDGQFQQANITKLTDQSTYTVGEFVEVIVTNHRNS